MIISTDQLGRTIELKERPSRIVSLVPSQTELLYDLGLRDEVVGITKFCIHPGEWFRSKTRVGGTKKIDFEKIKALRPDLIIGNKEENEEAQIKELMKLYPVWMSDIKNLDDALRMIGSVGGLIYRSEEAEKLIDNIRNNFNALPSHPVYNLKAAYIIWNDPAMIAGEDTFISNMLRHCGFVNAFQNKLRYPEISIDELKSAKPDLILLSSEPYPFKEKHLVEFQSICPGSKVLLVDGEMFSWYGSRLLQSPAYFQKLIQRINNGC